MEALKKIFYIPTNHQLKIDVKLPDNFPTGETEVLLIFAPKTSLQSSHNSKALLKLAGCLKDSVHFKGDPLTLQKALRDEWEQ